MIMKKFIFTLILLSCITIYADGQTDNKHFSYTTYIGTGLSMSQPSCTPFTWQIMGHYHINQRLTIGAGSGLSIYEKALILSLIHILFENKVQLKRRQTFS